ncbi:MAG: lasso peptide biosynthesis B2 protein [Pyrinomonadaceae bacterium]
MTATTNAATAAPLNAFSVVARKHRDGSVLLSAANDQIFKLNGVGALTWTVLEQSPEPLKLNEIVRELYAQFETMNTGDEARYEVSEEQLKTDTSRFLRSLSDAGLVQSVNEANGRESYRIREGISGTTSTTLAELKGTTTQTDVTSLIAQAASLPAIRPKIHETLTALFGLFAFDLLLRVRGFDALIRKVESWPTAEPHRTDQEICRRVNAMVTRAQVYYPKKAMCLQHSAVVTCLLRRGGVPAEMVLAAQEFPPKAHAWTEVAGTVVNDYRQVKTRYRELRRI